MSISLNREILGILYWGPLRERPCFFAAREENCAGLAQNASGAKRPAPEKKPKGFAFVSRTRYGDSSDNSARLTASPAGGFVTCI